MKEKVLLKQLSITRARETQLFQLKVPSDAEYIIGIETSVNNLTGTIPHVFQDYHDQAGWSVASSVVAGTMMLQSIGKSNLFYHTNVTLLDGNINNGVIYPPFAVSMGNNPWSHSAKRYEDEIKIADASPVLFGKYTDKYADWVGTPFTYKVNLYVWYSRKEPVA